MEIQDIKGLLVGAAVALDPDSVAVLFSWTLILISVYTDTLYYKILNKVIVPFLICGLLWNFLCFGWFEATQGLFRMLLVTLVLMPLYLFRFLGAGDIKLFSVLALFWSYADTFYIVAYAMIGGGIVGALLLLIRKNGLERFKSLFNYLRASFYTHRFSAYPTTTADKKSVFRFSYAIALGFLCFFLENRGIVTFFR